MGAGSLTVSDRYTLDLSFDGKPYPLVPRLFSSLSIAESVKTNLPTCEVQLWDQLDRLVNLDPVGDGSTIDISLGDSEGPLESAQFLFHGADGYPVNDSMWFSCTGTLNKPAYFRGVAAKAVKGHSHDALSAIATACGLNPVVDNFDDHQLWAPLHDFNWEFAHKIANHGWAGSDSCTSIGVDTLGNLHYRNMKQVIEQPDVCTIVYGADPSLNGAYSGALLALQYKWADRSGAANSSGGYNTETHQTGTDGTMSSYANVAVSMLDSALNINGPLKDLIGLTKVAYLPTSADNAHPKYAEAEHTNARGRATYSFTVNVALDTFSGLHLHDMVNLVIYTNVNSPVPPTINQTLSGRYVVTAKRIAVQGDKYLENVELTSQ